MNTEPDAALSLVVETSSGVYLRPVAHALPLPPGPSDGHAAEDAVDSCAAIWGLPDFVYRSFVHKVASGSREIGDRILLVGDSGLVVQIKRRVERTNEPAREEAWLRKAIDKAYRQARGTIRVLRAQPTRLVNGRGREITVEPNEIEWLITVIVDHDNPPEGVRPEERDAKHIVLLRRDWEFLFDQLRSTYAVVQYLKRAALREPVDLGREPVRYYELAAADAAAVPAPLDPRIVSDGSPISAPLLPQVPMGAETNGYHRLLRLILEDIATSPVPSTVPEEDRLSVLSEIDRLPVAHRAELGELLLAMLEDVAAADPSETKWRFRRIRFAPPEPQLAFGACSRFSDLHYEAFRQWVTLRHHEFAVDLATSDGLVTVGVLLTPRFDGLRPWDTTMVRIAGDLQLTEDELRDLNELWNKPSPSSG